ncbi:hypothetical protein C8N43_3067 [Litoreibacter ponti]|uniref:Uncharacterized protein n=1 Tax=Litoreibacter ponti TaxID=1510457 RepID=A0A2T6BDZ5_9RHOB|nr:hypothetical protein [Litoreibacter ponti]PTX54254.1 hypothetical protein C8N43_3067 [Litoreibacter ponti]
MPEHLKTDQSFPNPRPSAAAQKAQAFYELHGGHGPVLIFWLVDRLYRAIRRIETPPPETTLPWDRVRAAKAGAPDFLEKSGGKSF